MSARIKSGEGLIASIREKHDSLSEGQKRLARYIQRRPEDLAMLTATKLGEKVGLSESAVVRFAMKLGYKGYPEMQTEAQQMLRMQLGPTERLGAEGACREESALSGMYDQVLRNLKMTLYGLDESEIEQASRMLLDASEVYVFGLRSSTAMALHLGFLLRYVLPKVRVLVHGGSELFEELRGIDDKCTAVAICFPRYTVDTVDAFKYAKECGARTIAITDAIVAPVVPSADLVLLCEIVSPSFFESLASCTFMIEALVHHLTQMDKNRARSALERIEELLGPRKVWLSNDKRTI